jgi:anti-sigma regulatory factor (Ser/Thr protein kinase)
MKAARTFPPAVDSIPDARRFVLAALGAVTQDLRDAVSVLVSELAMNAVQHARTPFEVTVEVTGRVLRVQVTDSGGGTAEAQPLPPATSPHGRGLFLVDRLADAWGVSPDRPGPSKSVWFTIDLSAPTGSFPRQSAATEQQPLAGTPASPPSPGQRIRRSRPEHDPDLTGKSSGQVGGRLEGAFDVYANQVLLIATAAPHAASRRKSGKASGFRWAPGPRWHCSAACARRRCQPYRAWSWQLAMSPDPAMCRYQCRPHR